MSSTKNRFATTAQTVRRCMLATAIAACLAGLHASAQAAGSAPPAPATPATFKGCVQKAPGSDGTIVISTANTCARLTGKLAADPLAGHEVELQGILTPRVSGAAASIEVNSVVKVGDACSQVCTLRPPGTRGLRRPDKAVPGSEGGTPGVAPKPQGTNPN